jgi:dihydroflavonol-4-reductase
MKVLVLGATGLLGANLVRALLNRGDQVRVLVRSIQSAAQAKRHHVALHGLEVERVDGDLRDAASLAQACAGVRVVYHCAAYYPTETIPATAAVAQALEETKHVLDACRGASVERLVFGSTLTTIGFPPDANRPATEDCPFVSRYPNNPYLMAKAAMEHAVLEAAKTGVPTVVVNPTAFFGPFDGRPTSGTQILMIAKRMMPGYIPGQTNVIDVRDVAAGMIKAAERGKVGERYILGNWNTTQKDLCLLIARVAGVMPPLFPAPFEVARYGSKVGEWAFRTILRRPAPVPGFFIEVLQHMQHYDCSKGIRELDYPRNSVEQAIRDAITWFRGNGYLPA